MRAKPVMERRVPLFSKRSLRTTHAILAATWLTGAAWLLLHYFLWRQGELGLGPHPFEPWSLKLHGASAFAALWLAGFLWSSHIVPAWTRMRRPASGVTLAALLAALIVSGYLLYYLGDESWRARVALVHWIVGLALPLSVVAHVLDRRRARILTGMQRGTADRERPHSARPREERSQPPTPGGRSGRRSTDIS
jgi:hypothetical protein